MSDVNVMRLIAESAPTPPKPPKKRTTWTTTVEAKAGPCPWLIRCWREFNGISQSALARMMRTDRPTVSRIECYKWPVTDSRLQDLSVAIGVTPDVLCTTTDDEAKANRAIFDQWVLAGSPSGKKHMRNWLRGWMVK